MSNQNDDLYKKWDTWIDHLDREIIQLFEQRQMFWEVQEIIQKNERIQSPSDFHFWMAVWYTTSLSVAVRRQCDNDKNVISYRRLLEGIRANPQAISRTRFLTKFADHNYTTEDANEDFENYAGKGCEYIDLAIVDQDIKELEAAAAIVKTYVDKRIAHHEKIEFEDIPKYEDLHKAIEHLGHLHRKYFSLFRCLGIANLVPTKHYEWKTIFLYPWIDP